MVKNRNMTLATPSRFIAKECRHFVVKIREIHISYYTLRKDWERPAPKQVYTFLCKKNVAAAAADDVLVFLCLSFSSCCNYGCLHTVLSLFHKCGFFLKFKNIGYVHTWNLGFVFLMWSTYMNESNVICQNLTK